MFQKKCVFWLVLSCLAMVLSGCGVLAQQHERPYVVKVLVDSSPGSGVTEASVSSLVDAQLPEVIEKRGRIEFYRLDDVEGSVLVGRFAAGTPARESAAALAAFARNRLAEGKRSFLLLREGLFVTHPRYSRLALALTVMSMDAPKGADVHYYLASDAREWSPATPGVPAIDMECRPPTVERWAAILKSQGLLPPDSLRGATVTFVGIRPMMSVPGDRCPANLTMMNQTRAIWGAAITNAGGKVVFARDTDQAPWGAVLFFSGTALLWWRKQRVKNRARVDAKRDRYAPQAIIVELIGPKPGLDPDDPEYEQAVARVPALRLKLEELDGRLRELGETLTGHVRWWLLAAGVGISGVTEAIAWVMIYRDAGVPSPERLLLGTMSGFFFLILIMFAAKHADTTGDRKWLMASIVGIGIIAVAATAVRVTNALTSGGGLGEELAMGVLLLCAALGPAIANEYLMRPLRAVLPLVRLRRELKKQRRQTHGELKHITDRLFTDARLRRAWQWEHDTLKACYDGINPPPTVPPTNGIPVIPLNGGVAWMPSASSSTHSVS